jgi:hypothetical protein
MLDGGGGEAAARWGGLPRSSGDLTCPALRPPLSPPPASSRPQENPELNLRRIHWRLIRDRGLNEVGAGAARAAGQRAGQRAPARGALPPPSP